MNWFLAWRYKRFHVSYLLGWISVGIMVGLGLTRLVPIFFDPIFDISISLIALSMFHQRRWWSIVVIVICGIVLGWGRGSDFVHSLSPYTTLVGQTVTVQGVIKDDPQNGKRGDQQFRVSNVSIDGNDLPGEIYVGTYATLDVKRGDQVILHGKLGAGFGNYQASLGFASLVSAVYSHDSVREFRDQFVTGVRSAVKEPAASLGIGFVVGQRSALSDSLDTQLRVVGLTHIVVASGYNLTILVRFARRLLEGHSKYLATVVSSALTVGFVAVSGLSPSMMRASIVTGLSLLTWYYGRRIHPLLLIFYVAAFTAYLDPMYIWLDVGWYLSFLAFAGVLIVSPLLTKLFFRGRTPNALIQIILETTAAQIMTLPLILAVFGNLPVLSIVSNALVAPVIPFAMLLTVLAGAWGMIAPLSAWIIGTGAEIIIGYTLAVINWLSRPEWAQVALSISIGVMVACYGLICASTVWVWQRLQYSFRSSSFVD